MAPLDRPRRSPLIGPPAPADVALVKLVELRGALGHGHRFWAGDLRGASGTWSDSPASSSASTIGVRRLRPAVVNPVDRRPVPVRGPPSQARAPGGVGQSVGQVYAANTLRAIPGVILAGFLLVPAIGVHASRPSAWREQSADDS
jgi:hypothetical protein